jgi:Bacterial regulatory proteins, tetR family.
MAENTQKVSGVQRFGKLSLAQIKAAEIFATNDIHNMTVEQIAEMVGVSVRTIYRWKHDRDFVAYQNEVAEQFMEDFLAEAYLVIKQIARSGKSNRDKLKAVELVLKNRGKLTDVQKVEAKVEDLRTNEDIQADIEQLQKELEEIEGRINGE